MIHRELEVGDVFYRVEEGHIECVWTVTRVDDENVYWLERDGSKGINIQSDLRSASHLCLSAWEL